MEDSGKKRMYFTREEDKLLISLVSQHRNIIEMKSIDTFEKYRTWRKITTLFKQKTGVIRSTKSLKNRYGYLKRTLRKKIANKEEKLSTTGDVPSYFMKLSSNEEELLHILKDHLVAGMGNNFDDDRLDVETTTPYSDDEIVTVTFNDEDVQNTTPLSEDEIVTVTLNEGVISESVGQQPGTQTVRAEKGRDIEPPEAENPLPAPSYQENRETLTAQELVRAKVDFLESEKRIKLEQHEIKLESHEMRQALRKAKLDLLQAKVKLVMAKTREIEEKEKKCDECK